MTFPALVLIIILIAALVFLLVGFLKKNKGLIYTGLILAAIFLLSISFLMPVSTVATY